VDGLDAVHVVTNARKAAQFERWSAERGHDVTIHDDGTRSNDDRLGAIGDIALVIERATLDDDLLVIAGDNLFTFSLASFVAFWGEKGRASALAVHDVGSRDLARKYGIVSLDAEGRVDDFLEKPEEPPSTLAATATYLYHRDHAPLVAQYLEEGHPPDQPGRFVEWLCRREPVYGYVFDGEWLDIGDPEQLQEADTRWRARLGLPLRDTYQP
jgi:glucose-1-phosphate thymidylyltransferase